jgi:hypothetical protein
MKGAILSQQIERLLTASLAGFVRSSGLIAPARRSELSLGSLEGCGLSAGIRQLLRAVEVGIAGARLSSVASPTSRRCEHQHVQRVQKTQNGPGRHRRLLGSARQLHKSPTSHRRAKACSVPAKVPERALFGGGVEEGERCPERSAL